MSCIANRPDPTSTSIRSKTWPAELVTACTTFDLCQYQSTIRPTSGLTCHMITPAILLNMNRAVRTSLGVRLQVRLGCSIFHGFLLSSEMLRASQAFMHRHFASGAVPVSTGMTLEDMAAFVYDAVFAARGRTSAVLWVGA